MESDSYSKKKKSSLKHSIVTDLRQSDMFLFNSSNNPSSLPVCRFLWRPAYSCMPELLHGGHGAAAAWSVSATKPNPAPASPVLLRALSARQRAH